ncbi:helix-turn-helix transcriptional regulator [Sulfitobacter sp.]|uniref:helix-turn-helix transcriptional regulator n=1 Tax=Sulfitobacter sp. TaxID=1903071 RepID=UPI003001C315
MIVDRAANIEKGQTLDAVWSGLLDVLPLIGMDFATYVSVTNTFEAQFALSNIPDLYEETPPDKDPFLIHCCNSYDIVPVGPAFYHKYSQLTDADRAFIDRAGARGFNAGFAIPMRLKGSSRFGGFILGNGTKNNDFSAKILPKAEELRLFCMIIHRRIEELIETPEQPVPADNRKAFLSHGLPDVFDQLTPRESEVIVLLSQGKTRAETAQICNISVHTVSDYAKHGYRKLGVHNRAEAAALMLPPISGSRSVYLHRFWAGPDASGTLPL